MQVDRQWVWDHRRAIGFWTLYVIYDLMAGAVLMWELEHIAWPSIIELLKLRGLL